MKVWFVVIIPPLILAVAIVSGSTLLWRFFMFSVAMLVLDYLWSRLGIRGLDGHVSNAPSHGRVGDHVGEEFTVSNSSKIPTPLIEAQEETDLPGYQNVVAFNLSSRGSHTWNTTARLQRRGQYHVGSLTLQVTDPLGFFPRQRYIGKYRHIIVYPAALELPFFQAVPHHEPMTGPRRWLTGETSPDASRVRQYISGDRLGHIHWHSTAHTGNLMVREFDPDRSSYALKEIRLVLDMHQASQLGDGDETTEEYGITIAASLAKKYLDSGKEVGLLAAGDQTCFFPPERGDGQLQHILQALALIRATGKVPIDTLLTSEAERFGAGSAVIIIMPSANPQIASPMRHAISRGAIVTAVLLDSFSFGGETSPANTARSLVQSGFQVYTVRQGVEIARALDSRLLSSRGQYLGDKAYHVR